MINKAVTLILGFIILSLAVLLASCSKPIVTANGPAVAAGNSDESGLLSPAQISQIDSWIMKNIKAGKIPGMSVTIVSGNKTIYDKGFGYADAESKHQVTPWTLFELGSNSKAFTALGILQMKEEGLLDLNDPVTRYIPWFKMKYEGNYVDITLKQLLYHTSGIPFKSIGDIPPGEGDNALEETVRTQVGKSLEFRPGEKFLYATINYDILGLVIQEVSGVSYEEYMKNHVLEKLGLDNTFLFRPEADLYDMSVGYKLGFLRPLRYDAPEYRGNKPAGYIITNAEDMAKWLKIQLGALVPGSFNPQIIRESQIPDRSVSPSGDGGSYAAGWFVYQSGGGEISHAGNNPNFSSFLVLRPQEQLGVAILANLDSSYVNGTGRGIMSILQNKTPADSPSDLYKSLDISAVVIVCITIILMVIILYFLVITILQIIRKMRRPDAGLVSILSRIAYLLIFLGSVAFCMYNIPNVLFSDLPWSFVTVWGPASLITALILTIVSISFFCLYYLLTSIFESSNDRPYFLIIVLSMASGFGNLLFIFVVNQSLGNITSFQLDLFSVFLLGISIFVFGQMVVRKRLLKITNEIVYKYRMDIINQTLNAPLEAFEKIDRGNLNAVLSSDTESVSDFANIIVSAATSLFTVICCFIYLGLLNPYGLLYSVLIIILAGIILSFLNKSASQLLEKSRDAQSRFFGFIHDLIYGFKELRLKDAKSRDFKEDVKANCYEYQEKRVKAGFRFANAAVFGEVLYFAAIGFVVFAFPVVLGKSGSDTIRSFVLIFLFMTGPVTNILNLFPQIFRARVSWGRIQQLLDIIKPYSGKEAVQINAAAQSNHLEIQLKGVEYRYKSETDNGFAVGPIDLTLKSGQTYFITGGNGSGKSTLAKLITGLYPPDKGEIRVNGRAVNYQEIGPYFSVIFADYYLFKRMYGIDYTVKADIIKKFLTKLKISDKLTINNGEWSSLDLSTGQRKRVALLVSYLEDASVYLFDEWAADQDPEFRNIFYHSILVDLKKMGKCVIVITHDDRYFGLADSLIKMEMGKVVPFPGN